MTNSAGWAPHAVIVGAPKAGTTGLFRYLSAHPGIVGSCEKEPHFFCTDFPSLSKVDGPAAYRGLFDDPRSGQATLEASVWYLYSREAIPNIERAGAQATRYIVALRNPVDVAVSLHGQLLRTFQEDVDDFATAWSLQEERAAGHQRPRYCPAPALLQYRQAVSFGEQVDRLLAEVDRHRVHFVDYRQLVADTRAVYLDLLAFLDLPDDGRVEFEHSNPSRTLRSQWLVSRLRNPNRVEAWMIDTVNPALKRRGIHPLAILRPHITKVEPRPRVDDELLRSIELELADEIRRVRELTGIDLARHGAGATGDTEHGSP